MKLKLDLHPIFSDTRMIEQSLNNVIAEAVQKRATEVEIIPGKGSGALKKTVLRFLERPDIKPLYHRVEKDDENFGRIFVHFRFNTESCRQSAKAPMAMAIAVCFCCAAEIRVEMDDAPAAGERQSLLLECGSCGSPNLVTIAASRSGKLNALAESGYEAES